MKNKSSTLRKGVKMMFDRETITERRSVKAVSLVTSIFVFVVAALFVMAFANPAIAGEKMATFKGEVIAVDHYAKTLTVKSKEPSLSSALGTMGGFAFATDEMTNVTSCTQNKTFEDIGVGEKVTVTYHEKDGKLFADAVDVGIPLIIACYQ
jgi:hypothetical protein